MEVKEQYTPPRCEELEMNLEGIIAASRGGEYGDPIELTS